MKTAGLGPRVEPVKGVRAMRREAQIAYEARNVRAAVDESDESLGPVLRAQDVDTDCGPAVYLSAMGDRPGSPMFLLSAALLRRLLATARLARPPRPGGRRPRRRLDIRV